MSHTFHHEPSEGTVLHTEKVPYRNGFLRKVALIALTVSLLSAALTTFLWFNLISESKERRNQTCRVFEGAHKQEVESLDGTYRYLAKAPPPERGTTLYKIILRNLRGTEREARKDTDEIGVFVPPYCDEPGVGLREPDPKVPKRPTGIPLE